jgi:hypothetical protein
VEASPLFLLFPSGASSRRGRDLPSSYPANPRRRTNFQTLRARAPESHVVRENDVAAVFTNLPPVGKNLHHPESLPQHTIGTTGFLRSFSCQSQTLPYSVCAASKETTESEAW